MGKARSHKQAWYRSPFPGELRTKQTRRVVNETKKNDKQVLWAILFGFDSQ